MASRFSFGSRRSAEASSHDIYETTRRNGAASVQGIGGVLRERREAMGVTLAEAEVATRIRQKYLAALESDEWQLLPGEVVGRGFLRNYATYLGLEPTEIIERRRSIADPSLSYVLADTSAGSDLPPVRQVDYRPKEVDLRDEPDVMETRELRLAPIIATLAVLSLAALLWFGRDTLGIIATDLVDAAQTTVASVTAGSGDPVPTAAASVDGGIVNPENVGQTPTTGGQAVAQSGQIAQSAGTGATSSADEPQGSADTSAGGDDVGNANETSNSENSGGISALTALIPTATPPAQAENEAPEEAVDAADAAEPTATSTPEPPTATPLPPEPTPTPTEEPTEEPVVVPPACPDARSAIFSPGVGQAVSGVVDVTGTATHEAFGYYKLEFAPGANAAGGFVYFDGGQSPVSGGLLGGLNASALGNGEYTILLTVVDQTGNFPPPCQVTISVQN